jgi:hypothetical protein
VPSEPPANPIDEDNMQKPTKPPTADSKMVPLADEDILDFAEEVLGSDTEDIIALDDETAGVSGKDDDVIDLTEMSDMPVEEDEDILDLTDELEEAVPEEGDIMALEEDTPASANFDDEILDLNAAIDELSGQEEEILDLEELAEEPVDSEEEIVVLDDVAEEPPVTVNMSMDEPGEFSIETDTIELTEADRKALEEEFGLEPETLGGRAAAQTKAPASAAPDESLDLDTVSGEMEETIELENPAEVGGEAPAPPVLDAGTEEEVLELSDSDQQLLEEELKMDFIDDDAPTDAPGRQKDTTPDDAEMRFDFNTEGLEEPSEAAGDPGADAPAVAADGESGEQILELTDEDAVALEDVLGSDFESDRPADTSAPAAEASVGDSEDDRFVIGEDSAAVTLAMSDAGESAIEEVQEEFLDLGELGNLDGNAPDSETTDAAPSEPPSTEDEIRLDLDEADLKDTVELSVGKEPATNEIPEEPLFLDEEEPSAEAESQVEAARADAEPTAAEEAPVASEQELAGDLGLDIEPDAVATDDRSEGDSTPAAAPYSTESLETGELDSPAEESDFIESLGMTIDSEGGLAGAFKAAGDRTAATEEKEMTVDFDQTESPGHKELHKVGDPISIRVKEPAFENHANEDDLLNKVFESETAPVSAAQLEQTVEKIVAKVLAEKVEVLLVDAIERAVTKEIERLKAQLLGAPGSDA